ncbi:MAG: hypothetical protein ACOCXJ_01015, partial [Planctomycetota bacterium]
MALQPRLAAGLRRWLLVRLAHACWHRLPLLLLGLGLLIMLLAWQGPDLADRAWPLPALLLTVVILPVLALLRGYWRWRDPGRLARDLDARLPAGADELVSAAVSFCRSPQAGSATWMQWRTILLAIKRLEAVHLPALVTWRWRPALLALAGTGLAMICLAVLLPGTRARLVYALMPESTDPPSGGQQVRLQHPRRLQAMVGQELVVQVHCEPARDAGHLELLWDDGQRHRVALAAGEQGLQALLQPRGGTARLRAVVADGRSAWHRLQVESAPILEAVVLRVQAPAYAQQQDRQLPPGQHAILAGSSFHFS